MVTPSVPAKIENVRWIGGPCSTTFPRSFVERSFALYVSRGCLATLAIPFLEAMYVSCRKTSDVQCSWPAQYFGDLIDKLHVQYLMNLQHSLAEACFTFCARQIALVAAQHSY